MTLLAIFEALVGANAIWETTVRYLSVLSGNFECQGQGVGIKTLVQGNQSAVHTRLDQVVGKVLKWKWK